MLIPGARTKNHRPHTVYLSEQAVDLLKSREQEDRYVFPVPRSKDGHARPDTLRKRLKRYMEELELDTALTVHEIRGLGQARSRVKKK